MTLKARVWFGGHIWKLFERQKGVFDLFYYDRRLNKFYSVWIGHWDGESLTGTFFIENKKWDFTPVSKDLVLELVDFIEQIFLGGE